MGTNLSADPVLQGRDDLASGRVVLRVGGEDHEHVEAEPNGVAFDLDVTLLEDVEEPHLDLPRQVGELVDGEDPPVGPWEEAVVDGELVGQDVPTPSRFDGIHITDHVGDGDVGGSQFFDVPVFPGDPLEGGLVPQLLHQKPSVFGDGSEGIVVHLAAGQDG